MTALINGEISQAVDVADRGLHYGDGVFETIAVIDGQAPLWAGHMRRLTAGCDRLGIPCPDTRAMEMEAHRLCDGHQRAVLKVIVTRGSGGRGYRPPQPCRPTRLLQLAPWPEYPANYWDEGVRVRLCATRLSAPSPVAGLKHLNRLEQVLARQEWYDSSIAEGLMLDENGDVIDGTMSNVFMVQNDDLVTPDVTRCGVGGVMRGIILELGEHIGLNVKVGRVTPPALYSAAEVFVTNSIIGLWPVRELAGVKLRDVPGSVSRQLRAAVRERGLPC